MPTDVALAAAGLNPGWGKTRMTWTGWDDSVWEISSAEQKQFVEIVTTYLESKNLFVNPQFAPDGSTVNVRTNHSPDPSFENFVPDTIVTRQNLALNPSYEATTGGTTVVRRNLARNPVLGTDSVGWGAWGGTSGVVTSVRQTGQTGWAFAVATSFRATWTTASTVINGGVLFDEYQQDAVVAGRAYSGFMQVRSSKIQRVVLAIEWRDSANAVVAGGGGGPAIVLAANTVTNVYIDNQIAPAGATRYRLYCYSIAGTSGTVWNIGDWIEGSNVHFEETDQHLQPGGGPTIEYDAMHGTFSGSHSAGTYGPDYTYTWAGTAHASVSEMRAPTLTTWVAVGGSPTTVATRSSERALFGTYSEKIWWGTAAAANATGDGQTVTGLTVGRTYTFSAYLFVPTGSPNVAVQVDTMGQGTLVSTKDAWVRSSITFVATATSHVVRAVINRAAVSKGDDICYVDGALLEEGATLLPYFDGTTDRNMLAATSESISGWNNAFTLEASLLPLGDGWTRAVKVAGGLALFRGSMDAAYTRANHLERIFTAGVDVRNTGTAAMSFDMDFSDVNPATTFTIQPGEQRRVSVTSVLPTAGAAWFHDIAINAPQWLTGGVLEFRNPTVVLGDGDLGTDFTYAWTGAAHSSTSTQRAAGYTLAPGGSLIGYSGETIAYSSAAWSASGSRSLAIMPRGANTLPGDNYGVIMNQSRATTLGLLGKTITVSATHRQNAPKQGTLDARQGSVMVYITAASIGGLQGYQSTSAPNTNTPTRVSRTVTIPADTTYIEVRLYNGSADKRDVVYWDDVLIEEGDRVEPYFAGDTDAAGDFTYGWTGTPAASSSVQKGLAVPGWTTNNGVAHLSTAVAPPPGSPAGTRVVRTVMNHGATSAGLVQNVSRAAVSGVNFVQSAHVYVPTSYGLTPPTQTVRLGGLAAEAGYPINQWFDSEARDTWSRLYMTVKPLGVAPGLNIVFFSAGNLPAAGSPREVFVALPQLELASPDGLPTAWVDDAQVRVDTPQPAVPVIESGVFVVNQGVRGLSMPPITRYTSTSPTVAGSRHRGERTEERSCFWPLVVASDESSDVFTARERAFFKTLRPGKVGTWAVTQPNGETRTLQCRFVDDGDATHDRDPLFFGVATYGITLAAEQPYWQGQAISRTWKSPSGSGFFAGPGIINIAPQHNLSTAVIDNPGDVDGWMVWTLRGGFTTAEVGVNGKSIEIPFALASDRKLVIDTRPDALTAFEYAVTDETLTGAYIDRTDDLGFTEFGSIPPGDSVPLEIAIVGGDAQAFISGDLIPLYYRAW